MGLGGLRKTTKELWTGNQFSTLNSSMICPLRESDFPMVLIMAVPLIIGLDNRGSGRTTFFRRLDKIYGFLRDTASTDVFIRFVVGRIMLLPSPYVSTS